MKLISNFLALAGAELLSKLATILAFGYLAHVAGAVDYGLIEFAGAVFFCASLVVDQGLGYFGAREIARDPARRSELVGEIVFLRMILAAGGAIAVGALALLLDRGPLQRGLLLVYAACLFAMPFQLQWVFQGHERMSRVAVIQLVRQVVLAAVVLLVVRDAGDLLTAGFAEMAGLVAAGMVAVVMYRSQFKEWVKILPRFTARTVQAGATLGAGQLLWAARMFGATVFVGFIVAADRGQDLGYFGGAMRVTIALHAFIWLYFYNLLPLMSRTWQQGPREFAQLILQSTRAVAWASMIACVLWVLLAPWVMQELYGPDFLAGAPVLQWLAGVCVLAAIHGHFRMGLIAAGYNSAELLSAALGAVTAWMLIPLLYRAWAAPGAAVALIIAEMVVLAVTWSLGRKLLHVQSFLVPLIRPSVGLATLCGALWLTRNQPLGIQAMLACVLGAALTLALDGQMRMLAGIAAASWRGRRGRIVGSCK